MDLRTRAKIRKKLKRPEPDPSENPGELNIVPLLDIVVNLMLFLLATTAATMAVAQHDVDLGSYCHTCPGRNESLLLSVTVADRGIVVASRSHRLRGGCGAGDLGDDGNPTLARGPEGYDFEELTGCLARIHERFPEEENVTLTADPMVPYEDLVGAMDAIRASFPRVQLSAGVR